MRGFPLVNLHRNMMRDIQKVIISPDHSCTKIRILPCAWSFYKDCHPLDHLRFKQHWWELSTKWDCASIFIHPYLQIGRDNQPNDNISICYYIRVSKKGTWQCFKVRPFSFGVAFLKRTPWIISNLMYKEIKSKNKVLLLQ